MKSTPNKSDSEILRQKAEELLKIKTTVPVIQLSDAETLKLIHELQVHQIELEMLNEELKSRNEELRESEARFQLIYDNAPVLIWKSGTDALCDYFNKPWLKFTGRTMEQEMGNGWAEGVHPDDFQNCLDRYLGAFKVQQPFTMEYRLRRNDGEYRWLLDNGVPRFLQNGEFLGYIGSCVDITDNKQSEDIIAALALRNQTLLQTATDGIHIIDDQGDVVEVNPAFCAMLGYTHEEMLKLNVADWDQQWSGDELLEKVHQLIEHPAVFETRHRRKDGIMREIEINSVGVMLEGRAYLYSAARDITERKLSEIALQKVSGQLSSVIESSSDVIAMLDTEYHYTLFNLAFQEEIKRIFGKEIKPGDSMKEMLTDLPDDLAAAMKDWNRVFAGEDFTVTQQFGDTNLERHWYELHYSPIRDTEGNVVSGVHIVRNVTERKKADEELRLTQFTVDHAEDSIFWTDSDGRFSYVNDAACRQLGYSQAELLTMCVSDIDDHFTPQNWPAHWLEIEQSGSLKIETIQHTKDGRAIDVEVITNFLNAGSRSFNCAFSRDITESNRAKELLQQTRNNYDTFFNTIDDFLWVLDLQGNIIHINSTVIDRLGYMREELIGKSVLMVHPVERRDEAGRIVGEMLNGTVEFCPVPIVTKSGMQIPVETKVSHGFWDGIPVIFGVTKDISNIKFSEEKFSKLFHLNPSACGLSDLDSHKYIEINESFCTLLGFEKNEVIGRTSIDLGILTPETIDFILSGTDRNGHVSNAEAELRAKNGEIKHVLLSAENIHVQDKIFRFTVVHDVTDRKRMEQEIKLNNENLITLNAEKDKFFSIIAHDLRSPFNAFLGFTKMMAEELDSFTPAELKKIALSMRNSATNLYSLLENLLEWSRSQRGLIEFEPESFLLISMIVERIPTLKDTANKKGVWISYVIPDDQKVFADEYMLGSILRNLITNAVKFSHKGDTVTIAAKPAPGNSIEISVRDTGIGMSSVMVNDLFQLDVQVNRKGTDGEPSTGLGLLLCKDFIEKHGGKLWVESEEGKGSTFHFTLPKAGEDV